MSEKRVLTIERAKWARGELSSLMLNSADGRMCCLGFDALACGLTRRQIKDRGNPTTVVIHMKTLPEDYMRGRTKRFAGVFGYTSAVAAAMEHNDSPELSEEQREVLIREDLMRLGWDDVVFV